MSISTRIININKNETSIKDNADSNEAKLKNQQVGAIEKYLRIISNKLELCLVVNYK